MKQDNEIRYPLRASKAALYIFYGLLAYMPLHILLSTWIGTSFGILVLAKVAKDVVLLGGFLLALMTALRRPWFKDLIKSRLGLLILAYVALTVLIALFRPTDTDAEILGVVYNTRFLLFFLYGMLLARLFPGEHVGKTAVKLVLITGTIVMTFGVVQYLWLPDNALEGIGYSRENGVLPAFFIDDKPDLERVMSTVRDPNSLGSYALIIGAFGIALFHNTRRRRYGLLVGLTLACLFLTFSRSAWIGLGLVLAALAVLLGWRSLKALAPRRIKAVAAVVAILVVLSGITLYATRDSYFVRNVIFHADESTVLEDPNQLRLRFWQESVSGVIEEPLGTGPGTAGLASIRNEVQGTKLNENYYLQIASEVGILGLGLFVAILIAVGGKLYKVSRGNVFAIALLASFIGLAATNFLVHIWSNEAVAYTWWGLAGLIIYKRTP